MMRQMVDMGERNGISLFGSMSDRISVVPIQILFDNDISAKKLDA
jgi:hypothetical protein